MSKKENAPKEIKGRLKKRCVICGKQIKVILYYDKRYRGGHFFGKFPLIRKKEWRRVLRLGTRTSRLLGKEISVLKEDPKAYTHAEYWECSKCYWRG